MTTGMLWFLLGAGVLLADKVITHAINHRRRRLELEAGRSHDTETL